MGAMDTRNMYGNLAVNKYLHTVAPCWISSNNIFLTLTKNLQPKQTVGFWRPTWRLGNDDESKNLFRQEATNVQ